jgi:chromosomal replication initiation ATPase DnaA
MVKNIYYYCEEVTKATGVTIEQIRGPQRTKNVVYAAKILSYCLYTKLKMKKSSIGYFMNKSKNQIKEYIKSIESDSHKIDKPLRHEINNIPSNYQYICPQCGCKRNHTPAVQ